MGHWQPGHQLQKGRYVVEKILGYGGSGVTYRARDRVSGKFVAIKTLNALIQAHPKFEKQQEKFVQEAFLLARCHHQHVIRVEHVCKEQDLWCVVMEYLSGGDLRQYVNAKGVLSENEALRYIEQIGSALTYIHQQGFLHRDVKPANIMLREHQLEAVLIDFGLARDFSQDKLQTHTNSRTESFAPLEQYQVVAKRGAYTDVYALAATLYYLLTLQLPFPAPFRQQGATLIPPKQHNRDISDRIDRAILKGMELEPEQRPQSILAWLDSLKPKAALPLRTPLAAVQASVSPASSRQSRVLTPELKAEPQIATGGDEATGAGESEIDYQPLKALLADAKWKEADQETARLLLKVSGREKEGWLDRVHIETLPCSVLHEIDRAWGDASNQHFSFSTQKRIYESLGGTQAYNSTIWRNFGDRVGWCKQHTWLPYKDLNFTLLAPPGHLPMLGLSLWGFKGWIAAIATRLNACRPN
jgi:serine/threonine protein kinase